MGRCVAIYFLLLWKPGDIDLQCQGDTKASCVSSLV